MQFRVRCYPTPEKVAFFLDELDQLGRIDVPVGPLVAAVRASYEGLRGGRLPPLPRSMAE
jgi:hypothetical protein